MRARPFNRPRGPRRGVVLVSVLALLALGAVLVAGAFAAARAEARATRAMRAGTLAQAAARRALVDAVAAWSPSDDSLNLGASVVRLARDSAASPPDAAETRVRIHRLGATLWLVASESRVPSSGAPLARRRARVLLERAPTIDTTAMSPPRTIARWASGDLY